MMLSMLGWLPIPTTVPFKPTPFAYSLDGQYWIYLQGLQYKRYYLSDQSCERSISYSFETNQNGIFIFEVVFWNCDTTNYGRLRNDPRYVYEFCKNGECLVDSFTHRAKKYYTRTYKDDISKYEFVDYVHKNHLIRLKLNTFNNDRIKQYLEH